MSVAPVAVPEALRDLPRIVRVGERDEQEVRLVGAVARDLIQLAHRLEGDLVVVVGLHARGADPRRKHALHRVVPGQRVLERAAPVRRPVDVGGIDVGGQPLLEAVQLIGADEVHLAADRGVVAGGAQGVHHRGRHRPGTRRRCRRPRRGTRSGRSASPRAPGRTAGRRCRRTRTRSPVCGQLARGAAPAPRGGRRRAASRRRAGRP